MNQDDLMSQVTLPEPVAGDSGNGYRVRIGKVGTETFRCSEDFYLMSSADASELGGSTMEVVAPSAGALAVAGAVYTVEVNRLSRRRESHSSHILAFGEQCTDSFDTHV